MSYEDKVMKFCNENNYVFIDDAALTCRDADKELKDQQKEIDELEKDKDTLVKTYNELFDYCQQLEKQMANSVPNGKIKEIIHVVENCAIDGFSQEVLDIKLEIVGRFLNLLKSLIKKEGK